MSRTLLAHTLAVAVLACLPAVAAAQQRPLVTEDPETIGAGRLLLETGLDYGRGVEYPVSGLTGQLLRVPLIGVSIGISSIAELQLDGGLYNRLAISERRPAPLSNMVTATGDSTSSVEDLVVATKIRVLGETAGRPAFGLRLATKLPNASNESGIGLDTTDFTASILAGKTVRSVRTVVNAGFGILGDPIVGSRQSDVITYGASLARALGACYALELCTLGHRHILRYLNHVMPSMTTRASRYLSSYGSETEALWASLGEQISAEFGSAPGVL